MMWIMDSDGKGKRGLLYYLTIFSYVMMKVQTSTSDAQPSAAETAI